MAHQQLKQNIRRQTEDGGKPGCECDVNFRRATSNEGVWTAKSSFSQTCKLGNVDFIANFAILQFPSLCAKTHISK